MNIEERKQEARQLEQQGEFADALELYEAALAELEGTPEIWRELPLYVKAGDLSLKMGDSSGAIAHYEKAARAYAAYGSSKSVIALCTKILRVNSEHTHAFLRLVRLMIERDHLAEARLVLLEYSGRMKLPKAGLVLERMADRSDEELKPLLELLLELGGRYEYARAQGRDESTSTVTVVVEEHQSPPGDPGAEASNETAAESSENIQPARQFQGGFEPQPKENDSETGLVESESEQSFESVEDPGPADQADSDEGPEQAPGEAAARTGDDVQWLNDRASRSGPMPRASRKVLFREGMDRKNKPVALWIGLGTAAVIVIGGLSLLLFGVFPFGGSDAGEAPSLAVPDADPADSSSIVGGEAGSTGGAADDDPAASSDAPDPVDEQPETAVAQVDSQASVVESAQVETSESDPAPGAAAVGDTVPPGQPTTIVDPPADQASFDLPTGRGVMVQDFDIESTTEFDADGRAGFTVTQILGTGEQLTLTAIYYGDDIGSAPGTEEVTLAPLVGDTTSALIRFSGYAVEARAVVSASVLQTLLGRLIEVPPSS